MKGLFILFLAAFFSLAGCVQGPSPEAVSAAKSRDLSDIEKAKIGRSIAITLKDPDAAKFYWLPVILAPNSDGSNNYCLYMNGKNSYGGYEGFGPVHVKLNRGSDGTFDEAQDIIMAAPGESISIPGIVCAKDNGYGRFGGMK